MDSLHVRDKESTSFAAEELSSGNGTPIYDQNISAVASKFRGTSADEHDMAILGKKQVLRVSALRNMLGCMAYADDHSETSDFLPCLVLLPRASQVGRVY